VAWNGIIPTDKSMVVAKAVMTYPSPDGENNIPWLLAKANYNSVSIHVHPTLANVITSFTNVNYFIIRVLVRSVMSHISTAPRRREVKPRRMRNGKSHAFL